MRAHAHTHTRTHAQTHELNFHVPTNNYQSCEEWMLLCDECNDAYHTYCCGLVEVDALEPDSAADNAGGDGADDGDAGGADAEVEVVNNGSTAGSGDGDGHTHQSDWWFCKPCEFKKVYLEAERRKLERLRKPAVKDEQEDGIENQADDSIAA
jgi:hypothetical protein